MNYLLILTSVLAVVFLIVIFVQQIKFSKFKKWCDVQDKERETFMAVIIHELRSPLAVIQGSADLLIAEYQHLSQEQSANTLAQIKNSAHNLLGIVNDLLDLSKMDTGKMELMLKKGNINDVLTEEYNYYIITAKDRGVNLILDVDSSVPEFSFDYDKVKRVLNNLISNSLKFTEPGESIFLYSKNQKDHVEITVADNGKGIPEDKRGFLFNKFAQVQESAHKKDKSTGLGLAIAKGIVEAHKGKIWFEPNMPKGSKFIFTLSFE
ncbi:MAG TPA: HAMP domain-containing sensor histidine kinase [Candidatus Saccharimonadales bacterium]|nr:HAMP domain-containing sensor histidine kinase [Candidatus Saccharimonadales bacterium]